MTKIQNRYILKKIEKERERERKKENANIKSLESSRATNWRQCVGKVILFVLHVRDTLNLTLRLRGPGWASANTGLGLPLESAK